MFSYKLDNITGFRVVNSIPKIEKECDVKIHLSGDNLIIKGAIEAKHRAWSFINYEVDCYWYTGWCFHNREFGKAYELKSFEYLNVSGISNDVIKQTIGRKGCYFIAITERFGLNAIWHNRGYETIEFWGDPIAIYQAKQEVIKKLEYYKLKEEKKSD